MIRKLLFAIVIIMMVFSLIECKSGGDPAPRVEDVQLEKLNATWNCTKATRDGVTQDGYSNFTLTVSGTPGSDTFNYLGAGRPSLSPWPASGTWQFATNVSTDLTRDSNLPVGYTVTDKQLELTFTYAGSGFSGRVTEVGGQWVFTFSK